MRTICHQHLDISVASSKNRRPQNLDRLSLTHHNNQELPEPLSIASFAGGLIQFDPYLRPGSFLLILSK